MFVKMIFSYLAIGLFQLVYSQEFKHFKLSSQAVQFTTVQGNTARNPLLEQKALAMTIGHSGQQSIQSINSQLSLDQFSGPLIEKILGLFTNSNTDIYDFIKKAMELDKAKYEAPVLLEKKFGPLKISIKKSIEKSNTGKWWTFLKVFVDFDAQELLNALKYQGVIDIGAQQLHLFGGLKFRREYHNRAESPNQELAEDIKALGLFRKIEHWTPRGFTQIDQGVHLTKQDEIKIDLQASMDIPIYQAVTLGQAFEAHFDAFSKISLFTENQADFVYFRGQFNRLTELGYELEVKLDFLQLLQLTFFQGSWDFTHSKNIDFKTLYPKQKISDNMDFQRKYYRFVNGRFKEYNFYKDFIIEWNEHIKRQNSFALESLAWNKKVTTTYEKKLTLINQEETLFEKKTKTETRKRFSFLSTLLGLFGDKLFGKPIKFSIVENNDHISSLEYTPDVEDSNDLFYTHQRHLMINKKKFRRRHIRKLNGFAQSYTSLPRQINHNINRRRYRDSVNISQNILINPIGIQNLAKIDNKSMKDLIFKNCHNNLDKEFSRRNLRRSKRKIRRCFRKTLKSWDQLAGKIKGFNLAHKELRGYFTKFLNKFLSYNKNINILTKMVGDQQVYVYGNLQAFDNNHMLVKTPYHSGHFTGHDLSEFYQSTEETY